MKQYYTIVLLLFTHASGLTQQDHLRKQIERLIQYETTIDYRITPGFIVGILDGDSTYIRSFGQKDFNSNESIRVNNVFEIGGISKVLTTILTLQLLDSLDQNIHQSVNDLHYINPTFDSCKMVQLINHTSTLPKIPKGWGNLEENSRDPYAKLDSVIVDDFFTFHQYVSPPTCIYNYSHLNHVLLQRTLEQQYHQGYDQLILSRLPPALQGQWLDPTTVPGYSRARLKMDPWNTTAYKGSLGLHASLQDLIHLCRYFINLNEHQKQRFLAKFPCRIRKEKAFIGLSWQTLEIPKNRTIYVHLGHTDGHHAFIGFLPDTKTGAVILANSAIGSENLGVSILSMVNDNWKRK